jgi:hypothetical protein
VSPAADFNISWTGVDGSSWDLTNGTQGVYTAKGYSGLHLPTFTQQVSKAARVPGQRYLGTVYEARSIPLPVIVRAAHGDAWRNLDTSWWRSLSPEATGTLTVTTTSGGARSIPCRLGSAADAATDIHPGSQGIGQYALTLEADAPFWTGPVITQTYALPAVAASQNYYGGSGGSGFGPPFYISPSSALANATISNPGDRPAYSRWSITGPGTASFAINGHSTTLPPLVSGQTISIDTNPLAAGAVTDVSGGGSVNFWPQMGAHDFWQPIPAGAVGYPIPISFTSGVVGQSSVTVTLTPLYNRAW